MSEVIATEKATRSGSQKRRRKNVVNITFDDAEFAVTQAKASAAGLSMASFGRASILGDAGPRARRVPPVNVELLAYTVNQLNRVGNNLNQLNRRQNAAEIVAANDSHQAVMEVRDVVRQICDLLRVRGSNDR